MAQGMLNICKFGTRKLNEPSANEFLKTEFMFLSDGRAYEPRKLTEDGAT